MNLSILPNFNRKPPQQQKSNNRPPGLHKLQAASPCNTQFTLPSHPVKEILTSAWRVSSKYVTPVTARTPTDPNTPATCAQRGHTRCPCQLSGPSETSSPMNSFHTREQTASFTPQAFGSSASCPNAFASLASLASPPMAGYPLLLLQVQCSGHMLRKASGPELPAGNALSTHPYQAEALTGDPCTSARSRPPRMVADERPSPLLGMTAQSAHTGSESL